MEISIIDWILSNEIKNEKGDLIEFTKHLFLFDIYCDQSQNLVVIKPAQAGLSTLEILKNFYDAKNNKMDIIYTLPTDSDVNVFVGGKVNRIIAQNPILLDYVKDKDSIEQKQIGNSMIYFRGTFTKKAAIMVTADRLVNDEKDSSKQDVVAEYQARLQHSKFKQRHTFSHPSSDNYGVDVEWRQSDQKEWFIKCHHCGHEQYLSWSLKKTKDMSIDLDKKIYVCKKCRGELKDKDRAIGEWKAKVIRDKDGNRIVPKYSGYHISLLMAPWVSAEEIIDKFNDTETTEDFFYNKVLGLPYVGKNNKLGKEACLDNCSDKVPALKQSDRLILGIDTGLNLDYVFGNTNGLYYAGEGQKWDEMDIIMQRYPKCIAVVDAGGDLIGTREFHQRWKGRVYLCYLTEDNNDDPTWNKKFEVRVDRNKYIQLCVDEYIKGVIPLSGTENDWYEYWLDWNNLTRKDIVDPVTNQIKRRKWVRNGRDHKALATVFWRVGMTKFSGGGGYITKDDKDIDIPVAPRRDIKGNMELIMPDKQYESDWRYN